MIDNIISNVNIDSLEIKDVIDIEQLQKFQDNYAKSMNIASVTVDNRGNPVTNPSYYTSFCHNFIHASSTGDKRCAECHRKGGEEAARTGKPYIYTCHAGLIDFAAPILIDGKQIGTILGGQILIKNPDESQYIQTAKEIGINEDNLIKSLRKIKIISEENVKAAAEVLFIYTNALSKTGYEGLKLKKNSQDLELEVLNKNLLLQESNQYNKLKTQLFSTISHELKTPINVIFSSVQLLEDSYKNDSFMNTMDTFNKYSKVMKLNCYRLIRLINNVIDMNKIELGFYNINLINKNIVKTIEDVTLSVVRYANMKNIKLIFDTDIEEKATAFDEEKLERIILNLLSNSIKFTKPGGKITVTVSDKKQYVLICVKDTGIGIPDNMIEKIFDTFTQVDASLRRNAEGIGIGLSLVKSLVKMHNGEISVKSKIGRGSEFKIKLPVKLIQKESNVYQQKDNDLYSIQEKAQIEFSDIYFS